MTPKLHRHPIVSRPAWATGTVRNIPAEAPAVITPSIDERRSAGTNRPTAPITKARDTPLNPMPPRSPRNNSSPAAEVRRETPSMAMP